MKWPCKLKSLFICGAMFCFCQSYHQWTDGYFCFSHPSVVPTVIHFRVQVGMESTYCQNFCLCYHVIWLGHWLTLLVWSLVGWNWILFWICHLSRVLLEFSSATLNSLSSIISGHLCLGIIFWNSCVKILWLYCLQQSIWEQAGNWNHVGEFEVQWAVHVCFLC
jgi:hypothetical protein